MFNLLTLLDGVWITLLKFSFCFFNKKFLSSINLEIIFTSSFELFFFKIKLLLNVSIKPPLKDVITAQPLEALSSAVLPKGSCHVGFTTEIDVFS